MHVDLIEAATNLTELVAATERGEEVVIPRGKQPIAKLVAIAPAEQIAKKKRVFGAYKGLVSIGPEFFDPLPEEELALWNCESPNDSPS